MPKQVLRVIYYIEFAPNSAIESVMRIDSSISNRFSIEELGFKYACKKVIFANVLLLVICYWNIKSFQNGVTKLNNYFISIMITENANTLFQEVIKKYHVIDSVDQAFENPYSSDTDLWNHLLYKKCWIDTVQWHFEDIIRDPQIDPVAALTLKRKIDASNQERTDMVEYLDGYFLEKFKAVNPKETATINSESPAWAFDRLSILALKIYHMNEEATRTDASDTHRAACQKKLDVLLEQRVDLSTAIEQLLGDIEAGDKYMKVYKQMKMYNDDELNPVLRAQK